MTTVAAASTACNACRPGRYFNLTIITDPATGEATTSTPSCLQCPLGSVSPGGRFFTTNNTGPICSACPGASTTNRTCSARCAFCKPGHAGPLPCTACPVGAWSPGGPAAPNYTCTDCAAGINTSGTGSTSQDQCQAPACVPLCNSTADIPLGGKCGEAPNGYGEVCNRTCTATAKRVGKEDAGVPLQCQNGTCVAPVNACTPTCTNNAEVEPMGSCAPAIKDGCCSTCELKCSSKSQCMFGTQSFVQVGVCVPFPEPTTCYSLGLPPALELGFWNESCLSTPIGGNCAATCPAGYQPGSSRAPPHLPAPLTLPEALCGASLQAAARKRGAWDISCLTTPLSGSCTATCPAGYQPGSSGPPTSTCSFDPARGLVWGAPVGSCERVPPLDCEGRPAALQNGAWSCGGTTPDWQTCQRTCNQLFTVSGTLSARCTNGVWGPTQGSCIVAPRPPNPVIANQALTDCGTPGRDVPATSTLLKRAIFTWTDYTLPFINGISSVGNSYTTLGVMSNGFVVFGGRGSGACALNNVWNAMPTNACLRPGATETTTAAIFFDNILADSVLAYEDPSNQYVIIQYSMVTRAGTDTLVGQFQVYLFSNGNTGYIYNNVHASPESKGSLAAIGIKYNGGVAGSVTTTYGYRLENPGAPPRPVITFPTANAVLKRADLKLDWTMSAGSLGTEGTYFLYMGSDILLNKPLRVPAASYRAWLSAPTTTKHIPGNLAQTAWSFTPVLSNNAYTGWASVALFACSINGCSKACPVEFIITDQGAEMDTGQ
ncbi:hypothetical protein OEZ85_003197 [Tetradesmus obliquus]|uniref:Sushi domain-containing protein n=1 Tax=Tetradesmus obliquus TaxID=3088 RepID=A0ABY8U4W4_TETOB|nr:hypothetical protein OEZ85_003197 [Tetradesmus obliquus]